MEDGVLKLQYVSNKYVYVIVISDQQMCANMSAMYLRHFLFIRKIITLIKQPAQMVSSYLYSVSNISKCVIKGSENNLNILSRIN